MGHRMAHSFLQKHGGFHSELKPFCLWEDEWNSMETVKSHIFRIQTYKPHLSKGFCCMTKNIQMQPCPNSKHTIVFAFNVPAFNPKEWSSFGVITVIAF